MASGLAIAAAIGVPVLAVTGVAHPGHQIAAHAGTTPSAELVAARSSAEKLNGDLDALEARGPGLIGSDLLHQLTQARSELALASAGSSLERIESATQQVEAVLLRIADRTALRASAAPGTTTRAPDAALADAAAALRTAASSGDDLSSAVRGLADAIGQADPSQTSSGNAGNAGGPPTPGPSPASSPAPPGDGGAGARSGGAGTAPGAGGPGQNGSPGQNGGNGPSGGGASSGGSGSPGSNGGPSGSGGAHGKLADGTGTGAGTGTAPPRNDAGSNLDASE